MKPSFLFLPGAGIGDLIVSLPILDILIQYVAPFCQIDVCVDYNPMLYRDIIGTRGRYLGYIFQEDVPHYSPPYPGSLQANEVCTATIAPRLIDQIPEFMNLLELGKSRIAPLIDFLALFPHTNNYLANYAVELGLSRHTMPQWSLGQTEYLQPKLERQGPWKTMPPYITINDGWAGKSPKSWHQILALSRVAQVCAVMPL